MNKLIYSNIIRNKNVNHLRILSNRLSLAPSSSSCNGKVVVVSSGKGGVGKTTTAASFAYGLAELGSPTLISNVPTNTFNYYYY